MTDAEKVALFDEMLLETGDTLVSTCERSRQAIVRDGNELTLSADALEQLADHMNAWVGSRMKRFYDRTGRGAHAVSVELKVTTTGPLEPGGEPPLVVRMGVIDGRVRARALEG